MVFACNYGNGGKLSLREGVVNSTLKPISSIIYGIFSRFAWSVALTWMVFACNYGYGGKLSPGWGRRGILERGTHQYI